MLAKIVKNSWLWAALLLSATVSGQVMEVSGIVTDVQGVALPAANIIEKGNSSNSTSTDYDGKFSIKIEKGKILIFSYIGMLTKEVKVTHNQLNVQLEEDSRILEEVVVTGYGATQKKVSAMVGNVSNNQMFTGKRNPKWLRSTEEYTSFQENRFMKATKNPLSTFSLDVDAASYANIRRMINNGEKPTKDAVRVEEMINYFSYDYPQPKGGHPVNIVTETAVCPWNDKHQIVRIGVKAKEIPSEKLPPSNFVFLIDSSGSMYNVFPLVKSSMKLLVNNLRASDKVSIVVYAGSAGEVLPPTSGADKQKIIEALDKLEAGGSTAGGEGIRLAYKTAEKNFLPEGNNRVILCTDGDFNVGISSTSELENLIEEKRKSGVFLSVLGYGMGNYKDNKLQTLAQKGNGNHAYIDNLQEANKVLVNEFGSTMYAVAKDVKLQVEFNPSAVNAYRLIGYETRLLNDEDFNDDTKDAAELGAGHTVTALYEIVPVGVAIPASTDPLKYQPEKNEKPKKYAHTDEMLTVKLRYKPIGSNKSKKIEIPVKTASANAKPSADFQFAMAVAMYGQLLRQSDFAGNGTFAKTVELAKKGMDNDPNGYRREFVRIVEATEQLLK
ncbi:MAG: von Willebrand factor type A domain-containing protein [Capnocytophaga sp.]|nr:von Willebrand factor type A domain-containing protein [Capnocytophaga sp.]